LHKQVVKILKEILRLLLKGEKASHRGRIAVTAKSKAQPEARRKFLPVAFMSIFTIQDEMG